MTDIHLIDVVAAANEYPTAKTLPSEWSKDEIALSIERQMRRNLPSPTAAEQRGVTELTAVGDTQGVVPPDGGAPWWRRWSGAMAASAAFAAVIVLVGVVAFLVRTGDDPEPEGATADPAEFAADNTTSSVTDLAGATDVGDIPTDGESAPTGGTTFPDLAAAIPGDDGADPLPLGTVTELPDTVRLDFLFEFCGGGECFRDAHFMDPDNPGVGSGPFTAGEPFYIRHGFINEGAEPLGPGYDVSIYVMSFEDFASSGEVTRYTSDYVVRGTSDQCGPTYKTQEGSATCEWFVHEFNDGLPEGRWALWAVWEAPCSAWVELGATDTCSDPESITSFFASGFDSPFDPFPPSYTEVNEAQLTQDELAELYGSFGDPGAEFEGEDEDMLDLGEPIDGSGAVENFSTTSPDVTAAVPGDDGGGPAPLGAITELPNEDRLDFLFEFCVEAATCYRDAHFMDPNNADMGSGPWAAGRAFHIRHGFVNNGTEPLGEGFDVVVYITSMSDAGEPSEGTVSNDAGVFEVGATTKFTSDYVLRGTSDQCGPTYKTQTGPETCEWFVHDFPEGLPDGRYDIWVFWEAPCSAWADMGFTDSCADPSEVMSLFWSGVNSPFDDFGPSYTERNEAQG